MIPDSKAALHLESEKSFLLKKMNSMEQKRSNSILLRDRWMRKKYYHKTSWLGLGENIWNTAEDDESSIQPSKNVKD